MAISKYGNYIGKPVRGVKKTTLSLKIELREALEEYAKQNDMKISHVVENLIQEYIANQINKGE